MAAPGPPQLPWLRLGPRLRAGLEVALRVPSLFLIDAIFNSSPLPGGSLCAALLGVLLRLLGVFVSSVVLVLQQRALFKFYMIASAFLLAATSVLVNYYAALHINFYSAYYTAAFGIQIFPHKGPSLWMALSILQLTFGIGELVTRR